MVESDILTNPADNNLKICVLQGSLPPQMTADLGSQKAWFGFVKGDFYDQDIKTVNKNPFWGPESSIYTMLFGTWLMITALFLCLGRRV